MKKIVLSLFSVCLALSSMSVGAVSVSGNGCNVYGAPTFLFVQQQTTAVIINGFVCFAYDLTSGEQATISSIVSQAQASNREVFISDHNGSAIGLAVAMR